jgi:hypothetical protein
MKTLQRFTAAVAAVCVMGASLPLPVNAGVVRTDEVIAAESAHDRLRALLAREDLRAGLLERGVAVQDVLARVDALTDAEARELAEHIDSLPAGSSDFLGALLFIFILLLVTDILGLTKVFPFTRPVR